MKTGNPLAKLLGISSAALIGLIFIAAYIWSGKYQEILRDFGLLAAIAPILLVLLALGLVSYLAISKGGITARR